MAIATFDRVGLAEVHPETTQTNNTGLGQSLRQARERGGLSLDQVAIETKIPRRHLEAIEQDNFAAVPAGIYLRAEIRAYARAVRLDPNLALALLERAMSPAPTPDPQATAATDSRPNPALSADSTARRPAWILAFTTALAVVSITLLWGVFGAGDDSRDSDPEAERATEGRSQPALAVPDAPAPVPVRSTSVESSSDVAPDTQPKPPSAPVTAQRPTPPAAKRAAPSEPTLPDDASRSKDATTELVVATMPPGARVTVDGIGWGVSPVTIRHVPGGIKRIRVSLDGYRSDERSVKVVAGRSQRIEIPLRDAPGS